MPEPHSFLDRLRTAAGTEPQPPGAPRPADDEDAVTEFRAYALARGARPVVYMLEIRTRQGNAVAFDYGWLFEARLDPSSGITLRFDRHDVTVRGRCLRPLFDAIVRHRVLWIQEADALVAAAAEPDETQVTGVAITDRATPAT